MREEYDQMFHSERLVNKLQDIVEEQTVFYNTKWERDQASPNLQNALHRIKHGRLSKLSGTFLKAAKAIVEQANEKNGFIDKDAINNLCKNHCPRGRVYERWLSDLLSKLIKKNVLSRVGVGLYQLIVY